MIRIRQATTNLKDMIDQWGLGETGIQIYQTMETSDRIYNYEDVEQLKFEILLRENIVKSAYDLNESGVKFATFKTTRCNEELWTLTNESGFLLKPGVLPSTGIRDIFNNGHMYAFECATAITIVFYKGLLETIPEETFNRLFQHLYLWDGQYDQDLHLQSTNDFDSLPGDERYFINPDVNPEKMEWQGENVIVIGKDKYYGHGFGITNAGYIIEYLNKQRRKDATKSAYLTGDVLRPDFKRLSSYREGRLILRVNGATYFL